MTDGVGRAEGAEVGQVDRVDDPQQIDPADAGEITAAADGVTGVEVAAEAGLLDAGAGGDTFDREVGPVDVAQAVAPGSAFDPRTLADPAVTRAELDTQLQALSTPELTDAVASVDTMQLGFGADVTEQGWQALRGEVDRRFGEAMDAQDYANPELADLSQAVVRQQDFGASTRQSVWEPGWRNVATTMAAQDARTDPRAAAAAETLAETNTFADYRTAGRVPAELMTNRDLLGSVASIPGRRLGAELLGLTGAGFMMPGLAEQRSEELLGELDQRMAAGQVPLFDPATGEAAAGNLVTAATTVELASLLTPQGALRRGLRDLAQGGADGLTSAARIVRRQGDAIVDPARMRNVGEAIAGDPVATAAYRQLQRQGTEVIMDFGPPPSSDLMGEADWARNQVTLYMQNHRSAEEAVATLVHESSHISRFARGGTSSQLDEFYAFRREFLSTNGRRPTAAERSDIWARIQRDYADLPVD